MAAKRGNKNAVGNKGGAPSRYRQEYADQAYKISLLGATDKELADFFQVKEQTLNNWKKKHPKFIASIKKGKTLADGNIVERLYQKGMGFEHDSEEIKVINDQVVRVPIRKIYPPDTMAAIYWLNNRQKLNWKQKQTMSHEFTPEDMTDDQLDKIIEGLKQSAK